MTPAEISREGTSEETSLEAVRDAMARVLASPDFDSMKRLRDFLSYVVEVTLQGRPSRIKGYNITTLVFGRDDSFDPQVDSIVRIVASRLRRSLEHYYLIGGRDDALRIRFKAVKRIVAIDPDHGGRVVSGMNKRSLCPDLVRMVVEGLRKAGLRGRDMARPVHPNIIGGGRCGLHHQMQ
jgi:hypothetical protein